MYIQLTSIKNIQIKCIYGTTYYLPHKCSLLEPFLKQLISIKAILMPDHNNYQFYILFSQ